MGLPHDLLLLSPGHHTAVCGCSRFLSVLRSVLQMEPSSQGPGGTALSEVTEALPGQNEERHKGYRLHRRMILAAARLIIFPHGGLLAV